MLEEAARLGLDVDALRIHWQRIVDRVPQPLFPVIDSCRLDNGAILTLPALQTSEQDIDTAINNFATFVPAAGAASRYLKPLQPLFEQYNRGDKRLSVAQDLLASPMSEALRSWLTAPTSSVEELLESLPTCKALYPCRQDGTTFLQMKNFEHHCIGKFAQHFYVVPMRAKFNVKEAMCLEQGEAFCTLRFYPDGEPVLPLSIVPAGHGVLAGMFKHLQTLTAAHSLFIRNIDNVMGTEADVIATTRAFLYFHDYLWQQLQRIRTCLAVQDFSAANDVARAISTRVLGKQEIDKPLEYLMEHLFHTDPTMDSLLSLYQRPLTVLGQVRNTGADKGGVPVFVRWQQQRVKICLETPHMSAADAQAHCATHFNPVYVACELTDGYDCLPFWLLAQKTYQGADVVYHESLLYEALSNSMHCNSVYVEVPRAVFNPHKLITDGQ